MISRIALLRIALLSSILSLAVAGGAAAQPAKDQAKDKAKPAMVDAPKPAPELTQMGNQLAGTWRCTGKAWMPDGSEHQMQGTVTSRLDLDKFWIHDTLNLKMTKPPRGAQMPATFKNETFTTYDAKEKEWRRIAIDSMGGQMVGKAEGTGDKVLEWKSDAKGPMGDMDLKERFDMSDPKNLKITGQRSADDGKTWQNDYEATCKKG
jgi:hypothetical protein